MSPILGCVNATKGLRMKIKDDAKWSLFQKDVGSQGEVGRQFIEYMTFWLDCAEKIMAEDPDARPHRALGDALVITEEEVGRMDGSYLGPMLMYIIGLWEHGEELFETMTPIESKIVETEAAAQVARLQEMAAEGEA